MDEDHINARLSRLEAIVSMTGHTPDYSPALASLQKSIETLTARLGSVETAASRTTEAAKAVAAAAVNERFKALLPSVGEAMGQSEAELRKDIDNHISDAARALRRDAEAARAASEVNIKAAGEFLTALAYRYGA